MTARSSNGVHKKRVRKSKHHIRHQVRHPLVIMSVLVFAFVACLWLLAVSAATPSISLEAESGGMTGPAARYTDTTASGSAYVQFGNVSSGGIKALTPGTSWQWQLTGTINTTILDGVSNPKKMYDIDLVDTPAATIASLKAKNIVVICYLSAGTSENWRPDYAQFPASVKGKSVDGWAGENWLDVRNLNVLRPIMTARFDLAVSKGCDGVEPDNVDGFANDTGFPLTANDQINYLTMLANEAHARKLSIGLKNNVDQVSQLSSIYDWALNEECYAYNECGVYSAFTSKNKAVFGVEYEGSTSNFCPKANAANYDWLFKDLDLGALPRTACRNG